MARPVDIGACGGTNRAAWRRQNMGARRESNIASANIPWRNQSGSLRARHRSILRKISSAALGILDAVVNRQRTVDRSHHQADHSGPSILTARCPAPPLELAARPRGHADHRDRPGRSNGQIGRSG